ncbi:MULTISPECIES: 5-formyltetrahydrofolate cyclo-ligase [Paenibacillus]|nr:MULTISPECIES: 5-formyltetrahydrofolate cyclo-ligase [Paenibacillus]
MKEEKARLRFAMRQVRDGLPEEERRRASDQACRHASAWMEAAGCRSVMVYVPFRSELDTRPLIERAWLRGVDVYVPRCHPGDRSMTIHRLRRWDELQAGAYGILEPDPERVQAEQDGMLPDAVLVPGLAFDHGGGRLGYGAGYYDRLYERWSAAAGDGTMPVWAGIGFAPQVVDRVPMDENDARLQVLITDQGIYTMNKGADDGSDAF